MADDQNQIDDELIEDAEIVEEEAVKEDILAPKVSVPKSSAGGAAELINLESLIKQYITNMDVVKNSLKTQKEMFEDAFNNDETYRKHADLAKEANKVKLETRQEILKQPSVAAIGEKVKELRFEMKEMETSLADYLSQYQQISGANEIELADGTVMEIINTPKLVKRGY